MATLSEAVIGIAPLDQQAAARADEHQSHLIKPTGSLGLIEALGTQLAAIAGQCPPPVPERPIVTIFAGDHGVLAEDVSPWPMEVTAQMVASFLAGGASVNVAAREVGASVLVVDIGVATPIPDSPAGDGSNRLVSAKVRPGTDNLLHGAAMTLAEANQAIQTGLTIADKLVDRGADLLVTGDVGIGNSTSAAALVSALTGWPPRAVTGRGTGMSDEMYEHKVDVVDAAIERVAVTHDVPRTDMTQLPGDLLLAELGGLEIGGIAGVALGAAMRRVPVIVDGVVALAGALVAAALAPGVVGYLIAGQRSIEPGATAAMQHLGLEPLVDLHLRLGEGTGACLAVPMVRAAARVLSEMATFADAGVSEPTTPLVEPPLFGEESPLPGPEMDLPWSEE